MQFYQYIKSQNEKFKNYLYGINNEWCLLKRLTKNAIYYKNNNLNDTIYQIIKCLLHVSTTKYYGISYLVDVLRGANSIKINETKAYKIPEYGILKNFERDELLIIINWMINKRLILKTKSLYPVLHPTNEGINYKDYITVRDLKNLQKILTQESR